MPSGESESSHMKKIMLSIGLAIISALNVVAGETLCLKIAPERNLILRDSPQEAWGAS